MTAYATRADLKMYGQTDTQGADAVLDPLLDWFLAKVSNEMDNFCKQRLGYTGSPTTVSLPAKIDARGNLNFYPPAPIIQGITAISYTFDDYAPSGMAPIQQPMLPGDASIHPAATGCYVRMRNPNMRAYRGENITITVTYKAGYPVGTTDSSYPPDFQTLPDDLIKACVAITWGSYKAKDNANQGSAIPELGVVLFPHQWDVTSKETLKSYRSVLGGGR